MARNERLQPRIVRSKYPTISTTNLGYLNSALCPKCGRHLFSYYDKDFPSPHWRIWRDVNYCSKCGQYLDLDKYKKIDEPWEVGESALCLEG